MVNFALGLRGEGGAAFKGEVGDITDIAGGRIPLSIPEVEADDVPTVEGETMGDAACIGRESRGDVKEGVTGTDAPGEEIVDVGDSAGAFAGVLANGSSSRR